MSLLLVSKNEIEMMGIFSIFLLGTFATKLINSHLVLPIVVGVALVAIVGCVLLYKYQTIKLKKVSFCFRSRSNLIDLRCISTFFLVGYRCVLVFTHNVVRDH